MTAVCIVCGDTITPENLAEYWGKDKEYWEQHWLVKDEENIEAGVCSDNCETLHNL